MWETFIVFVRYCRYSSQADFDMVLLYLLDNLCELESWRATTSIIRTFLYSSIAKLVQIATISPASVSSNNNHIESIHSTSPDREILFSANEEYGRLVVSRNIAQPTLALKIACLAHHFHYI